MKALMFRAIRRAYFSRHLKVVRMAYFGGWFSGGELVRRWPVRGRVLLALTHLRVRFRI